MKTRITLVRRGRGSGGEGGDRGPLAAPRTAAAAQLLLNARVYVTGAPTLRCDDVVKY